MTSPHRKLNQSLVDVLERMKSVGAEDRGALFLEHAENLFYEDEEVLMVPNFVEEESK